MRSSASGRRAPSRSCSCVAIRTVMPRSPASETVRQPDCGHRRPGRVRLVEQPQAAAVQQQPGQPAASSAARETAHQLAAGAGKANPSAADRCPRAPVQPGAQFRFSRAVSTDNWPPAPRDITVRRRAHAWRARSKPNTLPGLRTAGARWRPATAWSSVPLPPRSEAAGSDLEFSPSRSARGRSAGRH